MKSMATENNGKRPIKWLFSYKRVSTERQEHGTGIERQARSALEVCQRNNTNPTRTHDWELRDLPPDAGVSGFKRKVKDGQEGSANRIVGTLGRFFKAIEEGQIPKGSILCFDDFSRFSRNEYILDPISDIRTIMDAGSEIYSCADFTHYTKEKIIEQPHLIHQCASALINAGRYSAELSRKVNVSFDLKEEKVKKGVTVALGSWGPAWLDFIPDHPNLVNSAGHYVPNERLETLKFIIDEYIEKDTTLYKIAQKLNEKNALTFKRRRKGETMWTHSSVRCILQNKAMMGTANLRGKEYPNYFPAVVTAETYERIQTKMDIYKNIYTIVPDKHWVNNLFNARSKCSHCGRSVSVWAMRWKNRKGPQLRPEYRCMGHRYKDGCTVNDRIPAEEIEKHFFLHYLQLTPQGVIDNKEQIVRDQKLELTQSLARVDESITKVLNLDADFSDLPQVKDKLRALQSQRNELVAKLEKTHLQTFSTVNRDRITEQIMEVLLSGVEGLPSTSGWGKVIHKKPDFSKTMTESLLERQLQNNGIRKQLVPLLAHRVREIVIDLEACRYKVIEQNGTESEWQSVVLPDKPRHTSPKFNKRDRKHTWLAPELVEDIRRLKKEGMFVKDICKKLVVSYPTAKKALEMPDDKLKALKERCKSKTKTKDPKVEWQPLPLNK